jgi:hypothetical protein
MSFIPAVFPSTHYGCLVLFSWISSNTGPVCRLTDTGIVCDVSLFFLSVPLPSSDDINVSDAASTSLADFLEQFLPIFYLPTDVFDLLSQG